MEVRKLDKSRSSVPLKKPAEAGIENHTGHRLLAQYSWRPEEHIVTTMCQFNAMIDFIYEGNVIFGEGQVL